MALQTEVRELVKKYGPELGDIYFQNDVAWDQVMKNLREMEEAKSHDQPAESVVRPLTSNEEIRLETPVETEGNNPAVVGFSDFSVSPIDTEVIINDNPLSESEALLNKKTN